MTSRTSGGIFNRALRDVMEAGHRPAAAAAVRAAPAGPAGRGVEFYPPHGERIRLLRACGLVVEDLVEVQAPEGARNDVMAEVTPEWSRRWPSEEVWFARRA